MLRCLCRAKLAMGCSYSEAGGWLAWLSDRLVNTIDLSLLKDNPVESVFENDLC